MKFTTKFKAGAWVWWLWRKDRAPMRAQIIEVCVKDHISCEEPTITYTLDIHCIQDYHVFRLDDAKDVKEEKVFATREEALKCK